jgi:hypothetical protein
VSLPVPRPGLVIRYSYLWKREADAGREEGAKDRPCAVVLALEDQAGHTRVIVLPITHSAPQSLEEGIEIPPVVKHRLGLDSQRSWVILNEANAFGWPGPDLRPVPGQGIDSVAYGYLPPRFFASVRAGYLSLDAKRKVSTVPRDE